MKPSIVIAIMAIVAFGFFILGRSAGPKLSQQELRQQRVEEKEDRKRDRGQQFEKELGIPVRSILLDRLQNYEEWWPGGTWEIFKYQQARQQHWHYLAPGRHMYFNVNDETASVGYWCPDLHDQEVQISPAEIEEKFFVRTKMRYTEHKTIKADE